MGCGHTLVRGQVLTGPETDTETNASCDEERLYVSGTLRLSNKTLTHFLKPSWEIRCVTFLLKFEVRVGVQVESRRSRNYREISHGITLMYALTLHPCAKKRQLK